jgi:hypothetical protein
LTLHCILNLHFSLYKLKYCTHYICATCIDTVHNQTYSKPMQWCTQFGNMTNTLILILHPLQFVTVRSHICNDRLLIWLGLGHVWNRGLPVLLLLGDNTILTVQLKYCLLYHIKC